MRIFQRVLIFIAVIILFFSAFSVSTFASEAYFDGQKIIGFADYLFSQGEYYRAIGEYFRFRYLYKEDINASHALFQVGLSYYLGTQYEDADKILSQFSNEYPDNRHLSNVYYIHGRTLLKIHNYSESRKYFSTTAKSITIPYIKSFADLQIVWSYALERNWDKAIKNIKKNNCRQILWAKEYFEAINSGKHLHRKQPYAASLLSIVLPGAGQVYCHRYRDAITALVINSFLIWGIVQSSREDAVGTTALFGASELFFYTGTIFSAYSSCKKYNRRLEDRLLKDILHEFPLSDLDKEW